MLPVLIAVVAVLVILALVVWLRRRPPSTDIVRDTARQAPPKAAPSAPRGSMGKGLAKTRRSLGERLGALFSRDVDDELWEELEEALIAADVGVTASVAVVERVKQRSPATAAEARTALHEELVGVFSGAERGLRLEGRPAVIVVVGVNGAGKTTTIAKLGAALQTAGSPVMLGAGDTFRAAAAEQLQSWAERLGLDIVSAQAGADPASVAFDAYQSAKAKGKSVVIVDTAGRLQAKKNLMDELGKVGRVLRREAGELDEVLLVLDGTTGQNGITQAKAFTEAIGVTGVVITKLDGTARGGVAVAVEQELGIPIKYVGVGESVADLIPFDPEDFVTELLGDR